MLAKNHARISANKSRFTLTRFIAPPGVAPIDESARKVLRGQWPVGYRGGVTEDVGFSLMHQRGALKRAGFRKIWKSVCTRAGVRDLLFHDLSGNCTKNEASTQLHLASAVLPN